MSALTQTTAVPPNWICSLCRQGNTAGSGAIYKHAGSLHLFHFTCLQRHCFPPDLDDKKSCPMCQAEIHVSALDPEATPLSIASVWNGVLKNPLYWAAAGTLLSFISISRNPALSAWIKISCASLTAQFAMPRSIALLKGRIAAFGQTIRKLENSIQAARGMVSTAVNISSLNLLGPQVLDQQYRVASLADLTSTTVTPLVFPAERLARALPRWQKLASRLRWKRVTCYGMFAAAHVAAVVLPLQLCRVLGMEVVVPAYHSVARLATRIFGK